MIKIACVGAGYFAPFHLEAWKRIPEVDVSGICDLDEEKARSLAKRYNVPTVFTDIDRMLDELKPTVIDIITPPHNHLELCRKAVQRGIHIICQKPLAPTLSEAREIVDLADTSGLRFMVHENFRFQPWYREIKELMQQGAIGDRLHQLYFRMRTGDGWPEDAYLDRQPYFRTMPRLLIYETGIHFIDTFRYLAGEITSITARLRQFNPGIAGEDAAFLLFEFENGAQGIWDGNRFNEPRTGTNPRYTFGEMLVEGSGGSLRLFPDGRIMLQVLGRQEKEIDYLHEDRNFAGDCVFYTQQSFVHAFLKDQPFETSGADYLRNLEWQEHIYEQAGNALRS
jgi:predicted dehydrogenase